MSAGHNAARVALVGSGEFLPVMGPVDRALLAGRPAHVVHLPTAAVLDGPATVQKWVDLAKRHYGDLGATVESLVVENRKHADDLALAAKFEGVGLIYLSGGNPGFLAETLRGTAVWAAIVEAVQAGVAIAGCSAGAMAMTLSAPDVGKRESRPGLGLIQGISVIPHFDRMRAYRPGLAEQMMANRPTGTVVVGIDEDTAIIGSLNSSNWTVMGRQRVYLLGPDGNAVASAAAGEQISFLQP